MPEQRISAASHQPGAVIERSREAVAFLATVGHSVGELGRILGITAPAQTADLIDQLRVTGTMLTCDPDTRTIRAGDDTAVAVAVGQRN
jgi:hypothetical protein